MADTVPPRYQQKDPDIPLKMRHSKNNIQIHSNILIFLCLIYLKNYAFLSSNLYVNLRYKAIKIKEIPIIINPNISTKFLYLLL